MSISITGRVVKTKLNSELRQPTGDNAWKSEALRSNHLRVQFADGSQRHLLFTNAQVARAIQRAMQYKGELPKVTWIREVWFEDVIDTRADEVEEIIRRNGLPLSARKINHIRANYQGEDVHFLFTDNEIRKALERAKTYIKVLPKVSWLTEELIEKGSINGSNGEKTAGEDEPESETDARTEGEISEEATCQQHPEME